MVGVAQQVGGALGLAILVTVFGSAARAAAGRVAHTSAGHPAAAAALAAHRAITQGMASSFTMACGFDAVALLLVLLVLRQRRPLTGAA
jgi:hypothetical protein